MPRDARAAAATTSASAPPAEVRLAAERHGRPGRHYAGEDDRVAQPPPGWHDVRGRSDDGEAFAGDPIGNQRGRGDIDRCVTTIDAAPKEFKELEIVVLREELAVLRCQAGRPDPTPADRVFLAAASRSLPRTSWRSYVVTPTTLLRWQRRLVVKRWTYPPRVGRPPIGGEIRELVRASRAREPAPGYQRIAGQLRGLGLTVSATTVRKLLRGLRRRS